MSFSVSNIALVPPPCRPPAQRLPKLPSVLLQRTPLKLKIRMRTIAGANQYQSPQHVPSRHRPDRRFQATHVLKRGPRVLCGQPLRKPPWCLRPFRHVGGVGVCCLTRVCTHARGSRLVWSWLRPDTQPMARPSTAISVSSLLWRQGPAQTSTGDLPPRCPLAHELAHAPNPDSLAPPRERGQPVGRPLSGRSLGRDQAPQARLTGAGPPPRHSART